MQKPIVSGAKRDCLPKPSGRRPHGGPRAGYGHGGMIPRLERDYSTTVMPDAELPLTWTGRTLTSMMDSRGQHQWEAFPLRGIVPTECRTWPAMSGNGWPIGTRLILRVAFSRRTMVSNIGCCGGAHGSKAMENRGVQLVAFLLHRKPVPLISAFAVLKAPMILSQNKEWVANMINQLHTLSTHFTVRQLRGLHPLLIAAWRNCP